MLDMKKMTFMLLWLVTAMVMANDGVFFVNGNQLVPLKETDVAVTKEVLTISLCDDGTALVDVQYEFTNRGKAKTVDMGFEAAAPYNADEGTFQPTKGHPYIFNFTVEMNGQVLPYKTGVTASGEEGESDLAPLDLNVWRVPNPNEDIEDYGCTLINKNTKESVNFSYVYYFQAFFKEGKNTVHHTYRYTMSYGVMRTFEVPYWLKPAMRWANSQIDDFTLRIRADKTAKYFGVSSSLFQGANWVVKEGVGKVRTRRFDDENSYVEVTLRNGMVEWHKTAFRPSENLNIVSVDNYQYLEEGEKPLGWYYDRSDTFWPMLDSETASAEQKRIMRNLPYAHRGYVFKDKGLQAYFNKFWWYMPDPSWKQDTSDFTKREWKYVNGNW
jgi:hypothetical protein